jgi:hypothetical protein
MTDNLRTLAASAGQCTHKPVDMHIDPFCTLTGTDTQMHIIKTTCSCHTTEQREH